MTTTPFKRGESLLNYGLHDYISTGSDAGNDSLWDLLKLPMIDFLVQLQVVKPHTVSVTKVCHPNLCRVFVLADPEVFSGSLAQVILGDFESSASASGGFLSPLDHMRNVVQHTIQAALGAEHCHGPNLAQTLKVSGNVQGYLAIIR